MPPTESQFIGCLLGQCLGDALGFPVEGYPPDACQAYVKTLPFGSIPFGRPGFVAGQYTDDSQLARELIESIVEQGFFQPVDYANRIARIFAEGRVVGRGIATEKAARRLRAGVPWHQAGAPPPAAGNGAAMRAAPIGLFFYDDPDALVIAAVDQGRITHQDPRACGGAVAIAGAVALAMEGVVEPSEFLGRLSRWVERVDPRMASAVRNLEEWLWLPPDEAVVHIAHFGSDGQDEGWPGISPYVIGSVVWALYSFLCSPKHYWLTLCTAISVGGDVDTTAAMAGAISGAYLGEEALPEEGVRQLGDQGLWQEEELRHLARQLFDLATQRSAHQQSYRRAL